MGTTTELQSVLRPRTKRVQSYDYRSSLYQIFPQSSVVVQFHIDQQCSILDAFLQSQAIEFGVFLSAYNPHGLKQPAINNTIAHHQLTALLKAEFWEYFPAAGGRSDVLAAGQTKDVEPAVFILNMDLSEGMDLAKRFAQEAFVQIVRGHPPALIWTEQPVMN